jgi:hypothetical protein
MKSKPVEVEAAKLLKSNLVEKGITNTTAVKIHRE